MFNKILIVGLLLGSTSSFAMSREKVLMTTLVLTSVATGEAGPVAGVIGYWVTKVIGYTGVAVGVAAGVTTGATAVVGGVAGAGAGAAAGAATGALAGPVGVGAGVAAAGASGAAGATTAGGVAAVGVLAAEAAGGVVVGIEAASTTVGLALTAIPFLP